MIINSRYHTYICKKKVWFDKVWRILGTVIAYFFIFLFVIIRLFVMISSIWANIEQRKVTCRTGPLLAVKLWPWNRKKAGEMMKSVQMNFWGSGTDRRLRVRELHFTGRLLEGIPMNFVDLDADNCAVGRKLLESRNID